MHATTWANDPVNSPNHYTRSHPGMECIDLNWNRLPPGNKAIYRNRVRTIIKTIQDKEQQNERERKHRLAAFHAGRA